MASVVNRCTEGWITIQTLSQHGCPGHRFRARKFDELAKSGLRVETIVGLWVQQPVWSVLGKGEVRQSVSGAAPSASVPLARSLVRNVSRPRDSTS